MDDTRRAIRTVRANAKKWNINPDRVGIVGFSAGGELAAYAGMNPQDGDFSSDAGHGFGFRPGSQTAAGNWPQRMCDWLIDNKLLTENP